MSKISKWHCGGCADYTSGSLRSSPPATQPNTTEKSKAAVTQKARAATKIGDTHRLPNIKTAIKPKVLSLFLLAERAGLLRYAPWRSRNVSSIERVAKILRSAERTDNFVMVLPALRQ